MRRHMLVHRLQRGWRQLFGPARRRLWRRPYVPLVTQLEARTLLSSAPLAIPVPSGQTTTIRDANGVRVQLKLAGPGYGLLTLTNGQRSGGQMDTLTLKNTTGRTSLAITTS